MQPQQKKFWFPAKRYGWGWGLPCCWEGWTIFLTWLVAVIVAALFLVPRYGGVAFAGILVLTAVFLTICFLKGEKPRWRWGKD